MRPQPANTPRRWFRSRQSSSTIWPRLSNNCPIPRAVGIPRPVPSAAKAATPSRSSRPNRRASGVISADLRHWCPIKNSSNPFGLKACCPCVSPRARSGRASASGTRNVGLPRRISVNRPSPIRSMACTCPIGPSMRTRRPIGPPSAATTITQLSPTPTPTAAPRPDKSATRAGSRAPAP